MPVRTGVWRQTDTRLSIEGKFTRSTEYCCIKREVKTPNMIQLVTQAQKSLSVLVVACGLALCSVGQQSKGINRPNAIDSMQMVAIIENWQKAWNRHVLFQSGIKPCTKLKLPLTKYFCNSGQQ